MSPHFVTSHRLESLCPQDEQVDTAILPLIHLGLYHTEGFVLVESAPCL